MVCMSLNLFFLTLPFCYGLNVFKYIPLSPVHLSPNERPWFGCLQIDFFYLCPFLLWLEFFHIYTPVSLSSVALCTDMFCMFSFFFFLTLPFFFCLNFF